MQKKTTVFILIILTLFSFSGCFSKTENQNGADNNTEYQQIDYKGSNSKDMETIKRNTNIEIGGFSYDKKRNIVNFWCSYPKDIEAPVFTFISEDGSQLNPYQYNSNIISGEEDLENENLSFQFTELPQNFEYILLLLDCVNVVSNEKEYYEIKAEYDKMREGYATVMTDETVSLYEQFNELQEKKDGFKQQRLDLEKEYNSIDNNKSSYDDPEAEKQRIQAEIDELDEEINKLEPELDRIHEEIENYREIK